MDSTDNNSSPKTFISYSWTTPEHEEWVLNLATQLVENGVDVILDKWHLREGDDSYAFMEKMVTDPDVRKVIIICDKAYAEKADQRKSGVGTETQIISPEIYKQVENQTKFVAIIKEKDADGNAYCPVYLKSRIFIDMSSNEAEVENFTQLLRWIFDKPLHIKPEIGNPPSYLFEETPNTLGTTSKYRQALDSIKQNKPNVIGIVRDYFETFVENFPRLTIEPEEAKPFADKVLESIESFTPFRDEVIDICSFIIKYNNNPDLYRELHNFFELLLPFSAIRPNKSRWTEGENDNLRFFVHELFLYVTAILIKNEKFTEAGVLLSQPYYSQQLASIEGFQNYSFEYAQFNTYFLFPTLRNKDERENFMGNLLKNRASRKDLNFDNLMQCDFLLYLYSVLHLEGIFAEYRWYPFTNFSVVYRNYPFEVFSKGQSKKYFDRLKNLIFVDSKKELTDLIEKSKNETGYVPSFNGRKLPLESLMNIEKLETTP